VQTNGMILNERVRKLLELGKYNINVSIDSLNSETFEFIRQGAKFEQVMKNIKEFKDYCKAKNTSFSSCISPMRVNYKDIPSVINHYNEQNDIIWINKYYFPAKYAIWSMSSVEIKNIIEELSMVILMDINDTSKYNNEQFSGFLKILVSQYIDAVKRETITIDFQKEVIKLIKNCNKLLDNFKGISNEDVSKAKESLEYIQDSNSKKLYFYLKFLLEIFSGDKLAENLNIINKEFIKNDLESISI
jgi:MoaA/NifB/PqqE/SkfB family radical SAM enzyme